MKAFPTDRLGVIQDTRGISINQAQQDGMDLRDYFAAQALTGAQIWDAVLNGKNSVLAGDGPKELSEVAYAIADAMMEARK
jgi:hypothetical protein